MTRLTLCMTGLAILAAAPRADASPTGTTAMYVHAQRLRPAKGFVALANAANEHTLDMRIRLTQNNPAGLQRVLEEVSDPASPRYGQYLTRQEVEKFTRPSDTTRAAVDTWLSKHGLTATKASAAGDWLAVQVPARTANSMLSAQYQIFAHTSSNSTLVRTLSYSIPVGLRDHIKTVWPGTSFMNPHGMPISTVRPLPLEERAPPSTALARRFDLGQLDDILRSAGLQRSSGSGAPRVIVHNTTRVVNNAPTQQPSQQDVSQILQKLNATLGGTLPSPGDGNVRVIVHKGPSAVFNGTMGDLPEWIREILNQHNAGHGAGGVVTVLPPTTTIIRRPGKPKHTTKTRSTKTITTTITVNPPPQSTEPPATSTTVVAPPPNNTSQPPPANTGNAPPPRATPGQTDADCQRTVTPKCLQQLYEIPTQPARNQGNKIGVTAYINQFGQQADLSSFLRQFRPDINPNTSFRTESINGGQNPQSPAQAGVEANLDLQYTIGVATGVPATFITVGNRGNGFLDTIQELLDQDSPPQVLTTSYGQDEDDVGQDVAEVMCNAYMQLGARGVSILFASGDSGVGDTRGECERDGKFQPTFPSGCPFLTSVGSTDGIAPERAAAFSSGGFSELFAQPAYQRGAVSAYLGQLGNTNRGRFNAGGRAFPDVSTLGTRFAIISGGKTIGVQGTSASSPVFASMIALLNDERAGRGLPPLGFLNPWLYGPAKDAFIDITEGSNPACGSAGFPARSGWDPVTGLGTPSYPALRAAAGLA
ncbi:subtilisin-like protein [Auricularia subglabra TFB-10046 SS5]|nr:subtilisin-like protein [Auricularia subglabra TFB-10046 SS5]